MMLSARNKSYSLMLFMIIVVLLSLGLMLSVSSQVAAGGLWSAWLFNHGGPLGGNPQLIRVYEDGMSQTWIPPLGDGDAIMGSITAFNDSGEWVAYCVVNGEGKLRLEVHNLQPESMLNDGYGIAFPVVIDLGDAVACQVNDAAFNSANPALLAFSVVHHWPDDTAANPDTPMWNLYVLDLVQVTLSRSLDPTTPALAAFIQPDMGYLPAVRQHNGNNLIVALEPFASGGWFEAQAVEWVGDSVTPINGFNTMNYATVPGSTQRAWLELDEARLAPQQGQPLSPFGTLVYQDANGTPYPIYALPQGMVMPAFVNHAQQIAFYVPGEGVMALNRDGTTFGLPVGPNTGPLLHMPGGYGFVETDPEANTTRLVIHRIAPGQDAINATVLWEDPTTGWTSVWSAPTGALLDLPPFPAFDVTAQ